MEKEILQQILSELKGIKSDVTDLKSDVTDLKQGQTKLEVILENEIIPNIKAVAEVHGDHTERLERIESKVEHLSVASDVHEVVLRTIAK